MTHNFSSFPRLPDLPTIYSTSPLLIKSPPKIRRIDYKFDDEDFDAIGVISHQDQWTNYHITSDDMKYNPNPDNVDDMDYNLNPDDDEEMESDSEDNLVDTELAFSIWETTPNTEEPGCLSVQSSPLMTTENLSLIQSTPPAYEQLRNLRKNIFSTVDAIPSTINSLASSLTVFEKSSASDSIIAFGTLNPLPDYRMVDSETSKNFSVKVSFSSKSTAPFDINLQMEAEVYKYLIGPMSRQTPYVLPFYFSWMRVPAAFPTFWNGNAYNNGDFVTAATKLLKTGRDYLDRSTINLLMTQRTTGTTLSEFIDCVLFAPMGYSGLTDKFMIEPTVSDLLVILIQVVHGLCILDKNRINQNDLHFGNIFVSELHPVNTTTRILEYKTGHYIELASRFESNIFDFDFAATDHEHISHNYFLDNEGFTNLNSTFTHMKDIVSFMKQLLSITQYATSNTQMAKDYARSHGLHMRGDFSTTDKDKILAIGHMFETIVNTKDLLAASTNSGTRQSVTKKEMNCLYIDRASGGNLLANVVDELLRRPTWFTVGVLKLCVSGPVAPLGCYCLPALRKFSITNPQLTCSRIERVKAFTDLLQYNVIASFQMPYALTKAWTKQEINTKFNKFQECMHGDQVIERWMVHYAANRSNYNLIVRAKVVFLTYANDIQNDNKQYLGVNQQHNTQLLYMIMIAASLWGLPFFVRSSEVIQTACVNRFVKKIKDEGLIILRTNREPELIETMTAFKIATTLLFCSQPIQPTDIPEDPEERYILPYVTT